MQIFDNPKPYVLQIKNLRSSSNKPLVRGLFHELAPASQFKRYYEEGVGQLPTFTLDKEFDMVYDVKGKYANDGHPQQYFYSLRRLYLECQDPNEYEFAKTIFGSWDHWMMLTESVPIRKRIDNWRDELRFLLQSQGCRSIINKALDGDVVASKFIATNKWQDVYERTKQSATDKFKANNEVLEDFERLKLIKGGKAS